ncbi:uncharacterized protein LOC111350221 [Spodoptera litura]|uniref:Uncharacterized protein LOC111350221 n=1 Tax=Spodoptera litura TaxID=69820 RepID=A0A9J7IJY2_SPOLT|nr:uncharacterized protein LOC111350221 [Spodoptera litura]
MPPRIRTRASKALKENIDVTENMKLVKTSSKGPRKALADKTNSASDEGSLEIPNKAKKTNTKVLKTGPNKNGEKIETKQKETVLQPKANMPSTNEVRPRRDRRLPNRFVENTILNNLSNSKESPNVSLSSPLTNPKSNITPIKLDSLSKNKTDPSPFKTPGKTDSSLLANRPRRICRLPSRLEDHSISPNKYIPIQPANASTPIQLSKAKPVVTLTEKDKTIIGITKTSNKNHDTVARPTRSTRNTQQKESTEKTSTKSSPDTNNNPKTRSTRRKVAKTQESSEKESPSKRVTKAQQSTNKKESPLKKSPPKMNQSSSTNNASPIRKFLTPMAKFPIVPSKPISSKSKLSPKKSNNKASQNVSFKLLGSKKNGEQHDDNENENDIYEFTFDPNEEPKPQKKKRKRVVTKKPPTAAAPKQKKVVYKSSYDQNISKALAALKNAVNPSKTTEGPNLPQITENSNEIAEENLVESHVANIENQVRMNNVTKENNPLNDTEKPSVHGFNYPSIRVEDIAADIEPSMDHHDDLNYSPVNSPRPVNGLSTPNASANHKPTPERSVHNNDPLNLAEELSFFDDQPVASSSMNMSVRHPMASPWRVEFGSLPIKWRVNAYVKPNMTPAVDTSFINSDDSMKKKHVYTNLLTEANDEPEMVETTPNLKQPSIISFMKEMAEKSARKKRGRSKSVSPTRAVLKENVNRNENVNKRPNRRGDRVYNETSEQSNNTSEEVLSGNNTSHDKENSKEEKRPKKRKNIENICDLPAKSPRKKKDKDCTFFGFDDSENQDENVSPVKVAPRGRSLRVRTKAVLQEINGPLRANLPVAAKTKIATSSEAVNRVYEELKSAADAPVFPEKDVESNETNVEESVMNDDSQSVHLFEDIEVVHHLKPQRKSYGKSKKVTFRQPSNSDSDTPAPAVVDPNDSTDYDDLGDLTFEIANVEQKKKVNKKKKPKRLMSKKEEKEAEEWAANFNSMCEDIEEFPLLVE